MQTDYKLLLYTYSIFSNHNVEMSNEELDELNSTIQEYVINTACNKIDYDIEPLRDTILNLVDYLICSSIYFVETAGGFKTDKTYIKFEGPDDLLSNHNVCAIINDGGWELNSNINRICVITYCIMCYYVNITNDRAVRSCLSNALSDGFLNSLGLWDIKKEIRTELEEETGPYLNDETHDKLKGVYQYGYSEDESLDDKIKSKLAYYILYSQEPNFE